MSPSSTARSSGVDRISSAGTTGYVGRDVAGDDRGNGVEAHLGQPAGGDKVRRPGRSRCPDGQARRSTIPARDDIVDTTRPLGPRVAPGSCSGMQLTWSSRTPNPGVSGPRRMPKGSNSPSTRPVARRATRASAALPRRSRPRPASGGEPRALPAALGKQRRRHGPPQFLLRPRSSPPGTLRGAGAWPEFPIEIGRGPHYGMAGMGNDAELWAGMMRAYVRFFRLSAAPSNR